VVDQAISLKTVIEHQKQVVKVASRVGVISKITLNVHLKREKKGAKIAMAAAVTASSAA
jgi:transposase-like protein